MKAEGEETEKEHHPSFNVGKVSGTGKRAYRKTGGAVGFSSYNIDDEDEDEDLEGYDKEIPKVRDSGSNERRRSWAVSEVRRSKDIEILRFVG